MSGILGSPAELAAAIARITPEESAARALAMAEYNREVADGLRNPFNEILVDRDDLAYINEYILEETGKWLAAEKRKQLAESIEAELISRRPGLASDVHQEIQNGDGEEARSNTYRQYAVAWRRFAEFSVSHGFGARPPSEPAIIGQFLLAELDQGTSIGMLRRYAAAIRRMHHVEGFRNPMDDPFPRAVMKFCTRNAPRAAKAPIKNEDK
jgi:hypothetical protein